MRASAICHRRRSGARPLPSVCLSVCLSVRASIRSRRNVGARRVDKSKCPRGKSPEPANFSLVCAWSGRLFALAWRRSNIRFQRRGAAAARQATVIMGEKKYNRRSTSATARAAAQLKPDSPVNLARRLSLFRSLALFLSLSFSSSPTVDFRLRAAKWQHLARAHSLADLARSPQYRPVGGAR